jgi:hypothetical protein
MVVKIESDNLAVLTFAANPHAKYAVTSPRMFSTQLLPFGKIDGHDLIPQVVC